MGVCRSMALLKTSTLFGTAKLAAQQASPELVCRRPSPLAAPQRYSELPIRINRCSDHTPSLREESHVSISGGATQSEPNGREGRALTKSGGRHFLRPRYQPVT